MEESALAPIMELDVDGVCDNILLSEVLWLLVTDIDVANEFDAELAGRDCVGFGDEELEVGLPERLEIPIVDDDACPEVVA